MRKEPVMGSHYLPYWETDTYGASRSPWRALCVLARLGLAGNDPTMSKDDWKAIAIMLGIVCVFLLIYFFASPACKGYTDRNDCLYDIKAERL